MKKKCIVLSAPLSGADPFVRTLVESLGFASGTAFLPRSDNPDIPSTISANEQRFNRMIVGPGHDANPWWSNPADIERMNGDAVPSEVLVDACKHELGTTACEEIQAADVWRCTLLPWAFHGFVNAFVPEDTQVVVLFRHPHAFVRSFIMRLRSGKLVEIPQNVKMLVDVWCYTYRRIINLADNPLDPDQIYKTGCSGLGNPRFLFVPVDHLDHSDTWRSVCYHLGLRPDIHEQPQLLFSKERLTAGSRMACAKQHTRIDAWEVYDKMMWAWTFDKKRCETKGF